MYTRLLPNSRAVLRIKGRKLYEKRERETERENRERHTDRERERVERVHYT